MTFFRYYGNGRFQTRIFILIVICFLVIITVYQFQEILLPVTSLSLVGNRFIQIRLDPLPRLVESMTESIDLEVDIDKSPSLSKDEMIKEVQSRIPNLPIAFWNKIKNKPMHLNATCACFPNIFELEFNNVYWQTLRSSNGTFQFYGAYLDKRVANSLGPAIIILGMIDRIKPTVITYCQIWFEEEKGPVIVRNFEYILIWYKEWGNNEQGIYQPYLMSCTLPESFRNKIPISVSVVEKACDNSTNHLIVNYEKPPVKKDFAVCVKGLDFLHEDISVRLVEWIELLGLLGADKIFFYELHVHPNISKVLKYYEQTGQIKNTPISLAGGQPNIPILQHLYLNNQTINRRQYEVIPYNDCFYKHMYEYNYIALLDIDEVIMPVKEMTWKELMDTVILKYDKLEPDTITSFYVRNVYFLDDLIHSHGWIRDIPKYMHMLQHVYRAKNFANPTQYVKCFHNTEKIRTIHNHYPITCLAKACNPRPIETVDAQLQHYRADCVKSLKKNCKEYRTNSVMDTIIWKYKDALVNKVTKTLKILGFFSKNNRRRNIK